jgi:hypothetical protein
VRSARVARQRIRLAGIGRRGGRLRCVRMDFTGGRLGFGWMGCHDLYFPFFKDWTRFEGISTNFKPQSKILAR